LTRGRKTKREVDGQGLVDLLSAELVHAFVEQVGAMPGQGVSSVFAFGKTFGSILGVLAAHGISMTWCRRPAGSGRSKGTQGEGRRQSTGLAVAPESR
jgi:crossover junction endodeoxyribonuclease RuvC